MSEYEYKNYKPLTIKRLVEVCNAIKGMDRQQSIKYGESVGVGYNAIDALRQILGYSTATQHLPLEKRNALAEEYKQGGAGLRTLAAKYGITYNAAYCIVRSRGIDTDNPKKWRKRDELNLMFLYKKGLSFREIGNSIGKSDRSVKEKFIRMTKKTA